MGKEPAGRPGDAGEHRVADALRDALATRRHGEMLFDMAAGLLAPAARVESSPDGDFRRLHRLEGSDPRWIVPWPLLTFSRRPRQILHLEIPGLKPAPPLPRRPGKAPNLRGLGPGDVTLHDGTRYVQVAYDEEGRWFETSRHGPRETLEEVLPVLAAGGGPVVERLADFVVRLDAAGRGPGRLFLPVSGTWLADGTWQWTLRGLRSALARGAIPADARWAAADPYGGDALGWGPTRDDALFAWAAEVERVRPGPKPPTLRPSPGFDPPAPPELPGDPGNLHLHLHFDVRPEGYDPALPPPPAPPPPPPETVPAGLVPLGAPPAAPPAVGEWRRFLGACGESVFAAFREDARGWTVLGDRPLALLGAPDAEAALDEADRSYDAMMRQPGRPRFPPPGFPWVVRQYRLLHEHTGERVVPKVFGAEARTDPGLAPLAGEVLGWSAARLRPAR